MKFNSFPLITKDLLSLQALYTDMRRLTTGLHYKKCVIRRFCRCVNVYLHKPR